MGIYSTTREVSRTVNEGITTVVEERDPFDGATYRRTVTYTPWTLHEWHDCFCCSCVHDGEGGFMVDPACRNHGFDGRRPCELHSMPGECGMAGVMPDSVEAERRRNSL